VESIKISSKPSTFDYAKFLEVLNLRLFGVDILSGRIGLGWFGQGYLIQGLAKVTKVTLSTP